MPYNLTGYPVGVMPITDVKADEQTFTDQFDDKWTNLIKELAANSEGMPISLQFIGDNYEDEKVLAVMKDVEEKLQYQLKIKI